MDETLPSWVGTDLIENGDFEDNPVTGASGWGLFDAIPGWIAIQGDLEIQKGENAVSDLGVAGNGLVELAGRENSGIQQTVTVAEGQEGIYLLSLDHARRRDDNWIASFDVLVDSVVVASVDTSVQGSVQQFELEVALTEGDHTIAFVETSRNDGRGTLIDNVSLVATGEPLPGVEPEPQGLSLSLSEGVIAEDGSTVATILRTGDVGLDAPLVVSVEVSGGDEAAPAVTEVSFAAGELSRDVVISGLLDGVVDGSQDVNVVVRSGVLEASASLTVTDVDVAPDPEPGANLIENGDFEDNPVTGTSGWGLFDAIPGWIAIQGDLEIQKGENAVSDLGVAGNGLVELAGRENSGIQQTVTVAEGQEGIYLLSLDHARRRDDNWIASFDVLVDGVVVASVDTSVQGSVQQFELEVALTEGDHTIAFVETSRNDGRGTLIDNVSLVATGEPLPPPLPADTLSFSDEADGRLVDLGNGSWSIPLKFLPLGDSITYGIEIGPAQANDTSLGGYRDDLWQSFVAQGILIDYVGRQATGPDNLLDQNHEGTPGIRADQIANYLAAQLPSFVPDVVLLMAGTNDSYQQVSNAGETTPQDIERLINIILAENPDAQIFVSTLLPQDPVNPRNAEALPGLAVANQGIMDLVARLNADGLTNIHLVDMSDLSLDLISDVGPDNRNDDGLHPTDEGYTEIASRWYDAINQAFADLGLVLEGDGNAIDSIIQNVIGSTGNDYLIGDARDNDLNGLAGNDILDGGAGNDSLTGSFGRDLFRVSEGNDVITDFDPSSDFIDLKGTGFTSFSEILAAAEQQGSDVVLFGDVAEMGMLTLEGVLLSDLSEDHFLYDSGDTAISAVTMASSSGNTMTAVSHSGEAEAHGEIVALYSDADWFDSDGGSRESMMDDRDSGDWSDNGVDDYSQPPIWDAWT
ncbi:GDSL-type esterase/lipase family protein [Hyphomonas atlantica corrig.]|uniref:GDSL-type esterase/lipase family protein n=4 Tax=Hyphomonas atlantica TaxID=1280948 RepID=UPI00235673E5|nr:GDSL-type esterase/lipase family protein [Hyphomonas atlantica]